MKPLRIKQFILAALLCVSTLGIAQSTSTPKTITVYGSVKKQPKKMIYKTEVTLTMDNGYYDDSPYKTLESLMAKYYEELKNLNIDTSKFIQDDLAYAATGYRKGGTVLRFETSNQEEIIKLTSVKMTQVTPSYVQVKSVFSEAEIKAMTKAAVADARKSAELLAEAADEEIDGLYSISGRYNVGADEYWRSANSGPEYFSVTVVYKLKD